ncbi:MAG TPA: hypothetical protein VG738_16965 [Chitinophagaceae bacterium]|nr:hypothetical protein [Chitinophagaceae bacterium]
MQPVNDSTTNTAVIMLVVTKNGTLPDARITNSGNIDATLTRRLKKALSAMPDWVPAIVNGMKVSCRTTLLIRSAD